MKHIDCAERALFGNMNEAAASAAVAANLFMIRTGTFIDEHQIRFMNSMSACVKDAEASTADKMLDFFKEKRCKHIFLVHCQLGPKSNGELLGEVRQFGNDSDLDVAAQSFHDAHPACGRFGTVSQPRQYFKK
jgi:hypothetical protein